MNKGRGFLLLLLIIISNRFSVTLGLGRRGGAAAFMTEVHRSISYARRRAHAGEGNQQLFKLPSQESAPSVHEVLSHAGLPPHVIDEACREWPGLRSQCDPLEEIGRRLAHLNFLIEQGVYAYETASNLIAQQPKFMEMKFGIVYENEDLFVMNKPHDVRMDIPKHGRRKWADEFTCSDWLEQVRPVELEKKRFAHNLDSATSGILCLSKNKATASRMNELFSQRLVGKEYLALVFGHVGFKETLIDAPIEEDPSSDFRMRIGSSSLQNKEARTQVEVLERGWFTVKGSPHYQAPVSKLKLRPITGRRHQLRVHMLSLGHAIVGDAAYADDWLTYRLFLHAHAIRLPLSASKDLSLSTADPFVDAIRPV